MTRTSLCQMSPYNGEVGGRILETVRAMMPSLDLAVEPSRDGRFGTFTCRAADWLTQTNATILIKQLIRQQGLAAVR